MLLWVGIVLIGLPLLLLVLVSTPPGTRLVVRKLLPKVNQQLNGRLTVEGIGGSLLTRLELRGVTLRDPEGEIVLQAERVDVGYNVWDLLHSKISLSPMKLEKPIVRLLKDHPGEQYSIVRVFQKDTTTATNGTTARIDLTVRDVALRDGAVLATIWRNPAQPQQENAQQLDTVQLIGVNLGFPLIHYSMAPNAKRGALLQIESASGRLVDPELELYALRGEAQMHGDSITIALNTVQLPKSRLAADAWLVTAPNSRRFDATAHIEELTASDISGFISGADIPPDWRFRGDVRTTSLSSGSVLVQGRNLDLSAAGGTVTGRVAVVGQDNEWKAQDSRLEVVGVKVERLLRAFHVPSSLRATIAGFITADGRSGSADLRLAGAAGYGVAGPVHGHIRANGDFDAMSLDAQLGGSTGDVNVSAQIATGKHLAVHQLRGDLARFNLAAVDARMPQSDLNGHFEGDVLFGSMPREGNLRLFLDSSSMRGINIDTAAVVARVNEGLLTLDSLLVRAPGIEAKGSGTFGLHEDQNGDLTLTLDAPTLAEMEPLVAAFTHDTVVDLDGALHVGVTARGSIAHYTLGLDARGKQIAVQGFKLDSVRAEAAGTPDSLTFKGNAAVDSVTALTVGGRAGGQTLAIDSLTVQRGDASWRMNQGAHVQMVNGKWTFDSATLVRDPGPGQLTISGTMPGQINVVAQELPLADVIRSGKPDSLPHLDANVTYAGGAANGTVELLVADRKPLTAEFTTKPLRGRLTADSLDLSLFGPMVPAIKKLGGRLDGDVAVEGAIDAPRLNGRLAVVGGRGDVAATGVAYHDVNAALTLSGAALTVDQMNISAGNNGGNAQLTGTVKFARLDRPELNLDFKANHFLVMNRRDFMIATATGDLHFAGSPAGATLTGDATVNEGTAFLERFMRSSGIDLSNPLYAQFVDTTVLRQAAGSPGIVEKLMDSLQIRRLSVDLGDKFWLRSPDASIQLAGKLTVNTGNEKRKTGNGGPVAGGNADKYRLVGTVRAVRGTYRMALAPGLTREFTIREGTIRYFGSPKTDAMLDLTAEHVVRTAAGDNVTITVRIGGALAQPTIALTSDVSPPLSETEIISYLVFGAPTAQAFLGNEGESSQHHSVFETSAQQLASVLSGKIESAVTSQLGLPIDYFRIKPGEVQSGLAGTELVFGMQVRIFGYPSFLRASPRFCPREQLLSLDHVGIDLETRFTPHWGVATSIDPMQGCEAVMSGTAARPYQLGVDFFWEKR